jgi:cellulose synthase operon protein C
LSPLELEEYELAIEEQAYPFEEQAIAVHENNLKLIAAGIYNGWIDKSLQKLAEFVPARYAKPEERSAIISSLDTFTFVLDRPLPPTAAPSEAPTSVGEALPEEPSKQVDNAERDGWRVGSCRRASAGRCGSSCR